MANSTSNVNVSFGGLSGIFAFGLSYFKWHSILWAILHGFAGPFYIVYFLFKYSTLTQYIR